MLVECSCNILEALGSTFTSPTSRRRGGSKGGEERRLGKGEKEYAHIN